MSSNGGASESDFGRALDAVVGAASLLFAVVSFRAAMLRRDHLAYEEDIFMDESAQRHTKPDHSARGKRMTLIGTPNTSDRPQFVASANTSGRPHNAAEAADSTENFALSPPNSSINSDYSPSAGTTSAPLLRASTLQRPFQVTARWESILCKDLHTHFYISCTWTALALSALLLLITLNPDRFDEESGFVLNVFLIVAVFFKYTAVALLLFIMARALWTTPCTEPRVAGGIAGFILVLMCVCVACALLRVEEAVDIASSAMAGVICTACIVSAIVMPSGSQGKFVRAALIILALDFGCHAISAIPQVQSQIKSSLPQREVFMGLWCLELIVPLFAAFVCLHVKWF